MKLISEYWSEDGDLSAMVHLDDETPVVDFYRNNRIIKSETFTDHALCYAQDAAENYVMGILKINT